MVKSAILVSRVRTFNRLFRKLNFLDVDDMSLKASPHPDTDNLASSGSSEGGQSSGSNRVRTTDAREVERFLKLENEVEMFTRSFPAYLQEPMTQDGSVDWILLNAFLAADLCVRYLLSLGSDPHFPIVLLCIPARR